MGLVKYAQTTTEDTTHIIGVYTENTTLSNIETFEEGSSYILIPLGVLLGIIILALLVSVNKIVFAQFNKGFSSVSIGLFNGE